jgi:hypothetical protein
VRKFFSSTSLGSVVDNNLLREGKWLYQFGQLFSPLLQPNLFFSISQLGCLVLFLICSN